MRQPMVMGNWKSNGSFSFAKDLIESINVSDKDNVEVVLFVPFVYLNFVLPLAKARGFSVGGQNVSQYDEGAFTGEITAAMLKDVGCDYVLVGHSERRSLFAETDEMLLEKTKKALNKGLKVVLCVGETKKERQNNEHKSVVKKQVEAIYQHLNEQELQNVSIAYEPVWAIGTGLVATVEDVKEMHGFIRNVIENKDKKLANSTQIVYGGSVKPENAKSLFQLTDVDGGLIGGASLKADAFKELIQMA